SSFVNLSCHVSPDKLARRFGAERNERGKVGPVAEGQVAMLLPAGAGATGVQPEAPEELAAPKLGSPRVGRSRFAVLRQHERLGRRAPDQGLRQEYGRPGSHAALGGRGRLAFGGGP